MRAIIDLYSDKQNEISNFLESFYGAKIDVANNSKWEKDFENPVEMSDMIAAFIDNNDKFKINMWISLDKDFFINVTDYNSDKIIRYLFERYPY